jgi:hypothetical protein
MYEVTVRFLVDVEDSSYQEFIDNLVYWGGDDVLDVELLECEEV